MTFLLPDGHFDGKAIKRRAAELSAENPDREACLSQAWREASQELLQQESKLPAFVTGGK